MTHPYYPTGNPHFNHVAMSLPADLLDETNRTDICRFWSEVFGFDEIDGDDRGPSATDPLLRALGPVHLPHRRGRSDALSPDGPLRLRRRIARRAAGRAGPGRGRSASTTSRVDLIDLHVDDQKVVKIHSLYVEVPAADDVRGPMVGVRPSEPGSAASRSASSSPRAGSSSTPAGAARRPGSARSSWPDWPSPSVTTTCGSTTTSRPCPGESRPTCFEAYTMLAALSQQTSTGAASVSW